MQESMEMEQQVIGLLTVKQIPVIEGMTEPRILNKMFPRT